MLDQETLKALIVHRIFAASDSCNSHHINRVCGQIEGLLAVLNGQKPKRMSQATDAFEAANIPFTTTEDEWDVPDS